MGRSNHLDPDGVRLRREAARGDRAFKFAMLQARDQKAEHFALGVVKDHSPVVLRSFHGEPPLGGSSAGTTADGIGSTDGAHAVRARTLGRP